MDAFGKSKDLKRANKIAEAYEYDGLVFDPPALRTGHSQRRLATEVVGAFDCALPIVRIVYGSPKTCALSNAELRDALVDELCRSWTGDREAAEIMLGNAAMAIEMVGVVYDPRSRADEETDDGNATKEALMGSSFGTFVIPISPCGCSRLAGETAKEADRLMPAIT